MCDYNIISNEKNDLQQTNLNPKSALFQGLINPGRKKKTLKHIFDSFYFSFQTGSHSVPLGRLELKLTEISGLCLPNAGLKACSTTASSDSDFNELGYNSLVRVILGPPSLNKANQMVL